MYDVIIIGAGPAGMTAGIYTARREMKTLILSKEIGGQLVWASEIENYPGFKNIEAFDLIMKMQSQVKSLGVEIKQKEVVKIEKKGEIFSIYSKDDIFKAKTVILSLGLFPRVLGIKGEKEFTGKGISYCANCDGPFYKNKEVAVVGGGNSGVDAAEVLSKIAKKVYLIHRGEKLKAFESLVKKVEERENIEIILNNSPKEFIGEEKLSKIILKDKDENTKELIIDGVFIEIGRVANTTLVQGFVDRNQAGEILVNNLCETKTPGMFAAGDVTQNEFKQISVASGQSTTAALAAYKYLQEKE
ncbi:FAD-binding protein [bacterium]|nr:FAD-binding protein [bacterium]